MTDSFSSNSLVAFYKKRKPYINIALTVIAILAIRFMVKGEPELPEFLVEQAPVHNVMEVSIDPVSDLDTFLATDKPLQWAYLVGDVSTAPFETIRAQANGWKTGWLMPFSTPFEDWRPEQDTLIIIPHIHGRTHELRMLLNTARDVQADFKGRLRILAVTKRPPVSNHWLNDIHGDLLFPPIRASKIRFSANEIRGPKEACAYRTAWTDGLPRQTQDGLARFPIHRYDQFCMEGLEKQWQKSTDENFAVLGPRAFIYDRLLHNGFSDLDAFVVQLQELADDTVVRIRHDMEVVDYSWNSRPFQTGVVLSKMMELMPRHKHTTISDNESGKIWAEPDSRLDSYHENDWKPYWMLFVAGLIDDPKRSAADRKRLLEAMLARYNEPDAPMILANTWAITNAALAGTLVSPDVISKTRLALEKTDQRALKQPKVIAHKLVSYAALARNYSTLTRETSKCNSLNDLFNELENSRATKAGAGEELRHAEVIRSRALLAAELIKAYAESNCWEEMVKTEGVLRQIAAAHATDWPVQYAYAKGLEYSIVAYRTSKRFEYADEAIKQLQQIGKRYSEHPVIQGAMQRLK